MKRHSLRLNGRPKALEPFLGRAVTPACLGASLVIAILLGFRVTQGAREVRSLMESLDTVQAWTTLLEEGAVLGAPQTPVRLLVFSDYTCPPCADLFGSIEALLNEYHSEMSVVYRHFPRNDGVARSAAMVAECGRQQGRFLPIHRWLFSNADLVGVLAWELIAERAGIPDLREFGTCINAAATKAAIAEDLRVGSRIGVKATPTVLVGGRVLVGEPPRALLRRIIRWEIATGGDSNAG